jgi:hypothetical protein
MRVAAASSPTAVGAKRPACGAASPLESSPPQPATNAAEERSVSGMWPLLTGCRKSSKACLRRHYVRPYRTCSSFDAHGVGMHGNRGRGMAVCRPVQRKWCSPGQESAKQRKCCTHAVAQLFTTGVQLPPPSFFFILRHRPPAPDFF